MRFMFGQDVNYLAILACGVASMIIGFVWYSKALFGNQWMKLAKISPDEMNKANQNMFALYAPMFVASLVMAFVLAQFIFFASAITWMQGAIIGFWAWLGFVATIMLTGVIFERKPMQLYYIQAGYQLVTLVVMGAILGGWV